MQSGSLLYIVEQLMFNNSMGGIYYHVAEFPRQSHDQLDGYPKQVIEVSDVNLFV